MPLPSRPGSTATSSKALPSLAKPDATPTAALNPLTKKFTLSAGVTTSATTPAALDITTLMLPQSGEPPRRTLPPEDPPFVGIYGYPDTGKSLDLGFTLPTSNTLWLCDPGALEPIRGICGYKPENVYKDCRTIADITEMMREAQAQGFTSVVIDDWASKMNKTLAIYTELAPVNEKGKKDGFYAYNMVNMELTEQRDTARYLGIAVFGNFWLDPPKERQGKKHRGGPQIPGNVGKELVISMLDMMLRTDANSSFKPWSGIYRRDPVTNLSWKSKDRYSLGMHVLPQNIAEILRFAGFDLEGSPWPVERIDSAMEPEVDAIAVRMWHEAKDGVIGREALTRLLSAGWTPELAQWILRDAVDRVRLWRLAPKTDVDSIASRFGW